MNIPCSLCTWPAEVWYPDGEGDQVPFCGTHEPVDAEPITIDLRTNVEVSA